MQPLPKLLTLIQINGDVRAAGRSIEDRDARGGQGGSGSSVRHHAVLVAHYVFEHRVAGGFGLVESFKGRDGDPDRATAFANRTPRRDITGAPVKAGTGWAFIADHERIALAGRAPVASPSEILACQRCIAASPITTFSFLI